MHKEKLSMIRPTLRRLRTALKKLVYSEVGPKAVGLFVMLFLLMLALNGLNVANSFVGRDFISSIEHRNLGRFQQLALIYLGVFAASSAAGVLFRYCEESLGLLWRYQLTKHLTEAWLFRRTYYRLEATGSLANPDQRLADDIRAFSTTTLSFTLLIVNGTITALSFSGVLWSISPKLFVVAVVYAAIGSLLTIWLGQPLVRLNFNQSDLEADFRATLIHVRQNAESIALSHREARFSHRIQLRLQRLTDNLRRIVAVNRNLGFFTNLYNYMIQIIPALVIAPFFIKGEIEFGVITQSAMAFATLLGAFSLVVTQFQSISAFSAVISRLSGLSEAVHGLEAQAAPPIAIDHRDGPLVCDGLTLRSGTDGTVLLAGLKLTVMPGRRWLVTVAENAAKQAFFRALAGLWEHGEGRIERPGLEGTFFLPERPYLPPGPLREVLVRTVNEGKTPDEEITAVLARLGLEEIVARVGGLQVDHEWDGYLSISEQHLFAVARILLTHPAFAVLDRPGSSLSSSQISTVLDLLAEQGIGTIVLAKDSESHLPYDAKLEIFGDGAWKIS
jgi:putative ATP-binding cassette transporter